MSKIAKIGDIGYMRFSHIITCIKVKVTDLIYDDDKFSHYMVEWIDDELGGGVSGCHPDNFFETKEACLNFARNCDKIAADNYEKQIRNMDELIDFCIRTIGNAEDVDYVAIDVIKKKYEEFKN